MNALEPWRQQLRADPARVVAGTLEGWLDRGPWQRAETTDFLLDLSDGDTELCELTAAAILVWARDKLSWDDRKRLHYGEIAHASQLADAFAILQRLDAPKAAYQLIEQHAWYESRTRPLRFDERLDLHRLFWLATAFRQPDDRFLPRWLEHCGHAGLLAPDWQEWLRIGLTGLRKLSHGPIPAEQQTLADLLLFHQRARHPLPEEAASFERRQFELLKELFPRGPQYWPDVLAETRERLPAHRELPPWMPEHGSVKKPGKPVTALPTLRDVKKMEQRIRKESLDGKLWRDIVLKLFRPYHNHAQCTGEIEFLVKTVGNLANHLLKRRPAPEILHELLVWVRRALDWDVSNDFLWTRLADCLRALGDNEAAEDVLWEALRRFPNDEASRNILAKLLRDCGETQEAETLLRETMERFPNDEFSRNILAELLRDRGETVATQEAEALLRETMKRFPNDEASRNILAKLLRDCGETEEAEALLRETETVHGFPNDHGMLLAPQFGIGSIRQNEWSMTPESDAGETEAFDDFPNDLLPINILPKEQVGGHGVMPDPRSAVEAFPSGGQTTTPENQVVDAERLGDPLIPWAAERAPIIRLALGMTPTAVKHRQLLDAAQTGGAAELAEVALRLLFPEDTPP